MAAPGGSDFVSCANLGIGASDAPVVHVLAAGCTVVEGWADKALANFADPRVAAVAPLVLDAQRPSRVLALGIAYGAGGARRTIAGRTRAAFGAAEQRGVRRLWLRGFFRTSALAAIGGWTSAIGVELADVELAWSLERSGYRTVSEPAAQVCASRSALGGESSFAAGLHAERMFWRHAGEAGWMRLAADASAGRGRRHARASDRTGGRAASGRPAVGLLPGRSLRGALPPIAAGRRTGRRGAARRGQRQSGARQSPSDRAGAGHQAGSERIKKARRTRPLPNHQRLEGSACSPS